jgi:hypothetical protein
VKDAIDEKIELVPSADEIATHDASGDHGARSLRSSLDTSSLMRWHTHMPGRPEDDEFGEPEPVTGDDDVEPTS